MAETARRDRTEFSSDVVRRMMARPIRPDWIQRPVLPPLGESGAASVAEHDGEVARLKTEISVMKAVLASERQECARLRAQVAEPVAEETLGDEARAVRDRWAAAVDRLLRQAA